MAAPRVLLVDDDEVALSLTQARLERAGYEVVAASGVVAAYRQIHAQSFDVLITDLHMPNPGDGFAVVTAMHYCQPAALTVVVSGFPDVEKAMEAILLQADEILEKPLDIKQLPDLMREKENKLVHAPSAAISTRLSVPSSLEIVSAGGRARVSSIEEDTVAIPILRTFAGTHGLRGDRKRNLDAVPASRLLGAPRDWCPHPDYTSLLRVQGASMEPLIHDGDILAVDSLQTDASELDGKIVVVTNEESGLFVSRFRRQDGIELLESEDQKHESIVLKTDSGWRILGRVLWWISAAP